MSGLVYMEIEGIRCRVSCIKYQSGIGKWKESGVGFCVLGMYHSS